MAENWESTIKWWNPRTDTHVKENCRKFLNVAQTFRYSPLESHNAWTITTLNVGSPPREHL